MTKEENEALRALMEEWHGQMVCLSQLGHDVYGKAPANGNPVGAVAGVYARCASQLGRFIEGAAPMVSAISDADPFNCLDKAVAAYDLSCERTIQDVRDMLQAMQRCLERCPPEQAPVSEAIALLANALWRTLSAPR